VGIGRKASKRKTTNKITPSGEREKKAFHPRHPKEGGTRFRKEKKLKHPTLNGEKTTPPQKKGGGVRPIELKRK